MMNKYRATAIDKEGKKYAGAFEAESRERALEILHSQGFRDIKLEVIDLSDEAEKDDLSGKKAVLKEKPLTGNPSAEKVTVESNTKRNLFLGKPFLISAAVLILIPLAIMFFRGSGVKGKAEDTVIDFFNAEFVQDRQAQYDLLTGAAKRKFGSAAAYETSRENLRKKAGIGSASDAQTPAPRLQKIEESAAEDGGPVYECTVRFGDTVGEYRIKLGAEDGRWKIREVREQFKNSPLEQDKK